MIDRVTDPPTPEELEQLARSVAMSGVLGDRDRLDVVEALRRLADIEQSKRGRCELLPKCYRTENDETPGRTF